MRWSVRLSEDVKSWLAGLRDEDFGVVAGYLDLLADRGGRVPPQLCQQLRCGSPVRELAVPAGRRTHRITYCLNGNRTILVLTVRPRHRSQRREAARAMKVLRRLDPRPGPPGATAAPDPRESR